MFVLRRAATLSLVVVLSYAPLGTTTAIADTPDSLASGTALKQPVAPVDVLLFNARVYTLAWDEPDLEGKPAANAPYSPDGWHPDAEALAIADGQIVFVGSNEDAEALRGPLTRVVDLGGATVIPGLVDSHTHVVEWGNTLSKVDLTDVATPAEAVARIEVRAKTTPKGQWVLAWGFDEGAWADSMPDNRLLSERIPDHPVHAQSLHSFASWNNQLALAKAGITATSEARVGGEIVRDKNGNPTGILLNNASDVFDDVIPPPTSAELVKSTRRAMLEMAKRGFVGVHEAGVDRQQLAAFQTLANRRRMPIRVYAMLKLTDEALVREWIAWGPQHKADDLLTVRAIKAYYDASLGARGARLLADYSDRPGQRGVSGADYGFDQKLATEAMDAGFQIAIHAIGDAGNRETLDFFAQVFAQHPAARHNRHRIEHAQIIHPQDRARFAELGIIASMEPPHAVEDKGWAADRLGPERVRHGYAWRSLRRSGALVIFNSDLAGSDPDIFYGLHAAVTRRDKQRQPAGGWFPEEAFSIEEAVRAYTAANAFAAFQEQDTGVLEPGRFADITVMDIDPFVTGEREPGRLLQGHIVMTIVNGRIVYDASKD
jgi:predicted amidohydrolase YtcJ